MTESIIQGDLKGRCYLCGRQGITERHHIIFGPFRQKSEKYGLVVHLCHWCHNEPPNGAHHSRETNMHLKRIAQRAAMEKYDWDINQFREIFGKNYL